MPKQTKEPKTVYLSITGRDLESLITITNYTATILKEKGKYAELLIQHNIITNIQQQAELQSNHNCIVKPQL